MLYNGKQYYHVFTSGNYPQANVSDEMLKEVAINYDPVNFHEAPVWLGHPENHEQGGSNEPEALAWIDSVIAIGSKLYVSFSYISERMKSLIESQAFKRVSVEIVKYKTDDGKEFLYLFAVGLTNRPAVKGLEPIAFAGHKFQNDPIEKFLYHEKFSNYNSNSNQMNQYLIKVAEKFGLDLSKFTTESSLQEAISLKFDEMKTKLDNPVVKDTGEAANLQEQLDRLQAERVIECVDTAIKDLKILPAQKEKFVELGKANFAILKETFANMTVHKDLVSKVITEGNTSKHVDMTAAKFTNSKGEKITYTEFLKLDPKQQSKFSAEEINELRKDR